MEAQKLGGRGGAASGSGFGGGGAGRGGGRAKGRFGLCRSGGRESSIVEGGGAQWGEEAVCTGALWV